MSKNKLMAGSMEAFKKASGRGMETVDPSQDMALSRIAIAHSSSPQVDEDEAGYIDGLKPGDIFDATNGVILARYSEGESILFTPIAYRKRYPEWGDREKKEGIVAMHETADILDKCQPGARRNPKLRFLPNGHEVRETAYFFGWLWDQDTRIRLDCYIAMSSKKLANARLWLNMAKSELLPDSDIVAPLYFRTYEISTRKDSNASGRWHIFKISRAMDITEIAGTKEKLNAMLTDADIINDHIDKHPLLVTGGEEASALVGDGEEEEVM